MTHYKKGADFERKVKKYYEGKGYLVVRSAGSKGLFDLVAIRKGSTLLIQCKQKYSYKLFMELVEEAEKVGAFAELMTPTGLEARYELDIESGNEEGAGGGK